MNDPNQLPLALLTRQAIGVLIRELGPIETDRFLSQFNYKSGDYTAERVATFEGRTVAELAADIRAVAARRAKPGPGGTGDPAAGNEAGG